MAQEKKRPPEFPAETYKTWKRQRWGSLDVSFYAEGTVQEIKKQTSKLSAWESVKPLIEELKKEAKAQKVEGLTFQVTDYPIDYGEETQVQVTAIGYRRKTEKEMIAGEIARERNLQRKKSEAQKKAESEKKQLHELLKKYPSEADRLMYSRDAIDS